MHGGVRTRRCSRPASRYLLNAKPPRSRSDREYIPMMSVEVAAAITGVPSRGGMDQRYRKAGTRLRRCRLNGQLVAISLARFLTAIRPYRCLQAISLAL